MIDVLEGALQDHRSELDALMSENESLKGQIERLMQKTKLLERKHAVSSGDRQQQKQYARATECASRRCGPARSPNSGSIVTISNHRYLESIAQEIHALDSTEL